MKQNVKIGLATMHILDVTVSAYGIVLMEPTKLTVLLTHAVQTVMPVYQRIATTSLAYPYLKATTAIFIVWALTMNEANVHHSRQECYPIDIVV